MAPERMRCFSLAVVWCGGGGTALLAVALWPVGPVGVTLESCPFLKYTGAKLFLLGDKVQKVGLGVWVLAGCQL